MSNLVFSIFLIAAGTYLMGFFQETTRIKSAWVRVALFVFSWFAFFCALQWTVAILKEITNGR